MLEAETLRQLLEYDPVTGDFIWKARPETSHFVVGWNKKFAGKPAGRKTVTVYREIGIGNRLYYAHRLAWLHATGEWPKEQIDHIDGNKLNNRFENLREASPSQNNCNATKRRKNNVGLKGVSVYERGNYRRFTSFIGVAGKSLYLGYFTTPEQAHDAYVEAAKLHHGEFART